MDFYPGIDIGTSRVKAVLFDEHFQAHASAAENTAPQLTASGYAEQDGAAVAVGGGDSATDRPPSGAVAGPFTRYRSGRAGGRGMAERC